MNGDCRYNMNIIKRRKYGKEYYWKNVEKLRKRNREWHMKNREKDRLYEVKRRRTLRTLILKLLGNKCNNPNCPIPKDKFDKRALQIDHIKGEGNKEIKKFGKCNNLYYLHVLNEIKKGTKKYQLLCAYCNWLKRYNNREIKTYE